MWLENDGATCHVATVMVDILHEWFHGMVFSSEGVMNWPPGLSDLIPLNFALWKFPLISQYWDLCSRVIENKTSGIQATMWSPGEHSTTRQWKTCRFFIWIFSLLLSSIFIYWGTRLFIMHAGRFISQDVNLKSLQKCIWKRNTSLVLFLCRSHTFFWY